ncbi:MAG: hypothetical protein ACYCSO_02215 [Cuniculiplasma sp.]
MAEKLNMNGEFYFGDFGEFSIGVDTDAETSEYALFLFWFLIRAASISGSRSPRFFSVSPSTST